METNIIPTNNNKLRPALISDAAELLRIYEPYILHTAITFEYSIPSLVDYTLRIEKILNRYPFFVYEVAGRVVAYAYAHQFRERAAYDWDIETSIYVSEEFQQMGIATMLYAKLLEACKEAGYHNAYAGITLPNEKSVNFHSKLGFTNIGTFKNAGFKQGKWYGVLFMELNLIPCDRVPLPIKPKAN